MTDNANYPFQGRAGAESAADGSYQPFRVGRQGEIVTNDSHGKYYESVRLGKVFGLFTGPTTTGIAAGHLVGATAAAVVQHAIINPANSGINVSILKFSNAYVSGTLPAGAPMFGTVAGSTLSADVTTFSSKYNLFAGGPTGAAICVSVAGSAGSALTGGAAVVTRGILGFGGSTASAYASAAGVNTTEDLNGLVVIPPGFAFVPLFSGAGTSVLTNMCTIWEEIPA